MAMEASYSAIILAGGSCSRFGRADMLKDNAGGKSVLSHSLDLFSSDVQCREIIVSASPAVAEWIAGDPLTFSLPNMPVLKAEDSRGASALAAAHRAVADIIVLHDANRPNIRAEYVARLLATLKPGIGAALVLELTGPVASLTEIGERGTENGDGGGGLLGPRADHRVGHLMELQQPDGLYLIQTPQAYLKADYLKAAEAAGDPGGFSDDSSMFIAGGMEVAGVAGPQANFAIIRESSLRLLDKLMGGGHTKKDKSTGLGW